MGTRKSVLSSQHSFAQIPSTSIQRSTFDRSHGYKTTIDGGFLYPIFVDEALPGDTFNINATLFGRLATPLHPFMDNIFVDTQFFSVPLRLLWDDFPKFMGEQDDPGDSTDFSIPILTTPVGGHLEGSLADYFGIPTQEDIADVSCLFHRAYNLIYKEWYRDENLIDSPSIAKGPGPDSIIAYPIQKRAKRHDYFTSCLPFAQKGTAVSLPLGTSAPVKSTGDGIPLWTVDDSDVEQMFAEGSPGPFNVSVAPGNQTSQAFMAWKDPKLETDLTAATAATINEIREAFQLQRMFERDARGGSRLTEIIRSHFGVISPDQRLQRPEYLGGATSRINMTVIHQTSPTTAPFNQLGQLAGYGTVTSNAGHGFKKSFVEHCIVIGLVSIRADLNYQQGLNRMWSRSSRFDFYWPTLAHLGEQEVKNKEIFADGSAADELVFGYIPRYDEYRYKPSVVTARMRSNSAARLDSWHLAQDFDSLPVLGQTFIEETPPIDRVSAVATEPDVILDVYFNYKCARPMPLFSVPGQIDRF